MLQDSKMRITKQVKLAVGTYEMTLTGSLVEQKIVAGQFVNLQLPNTKYPLRRPFGIAAVDKENQSIRLIYRVVGAGTKEMAEMKIGTEVQVLGPLGNGFPIDFLPSQSNILIISGGTGLPPLYELARQLENHGHQLDIALGFPTKNRVFYESEMCQLGQTHVITDDGSYQNKGLITDLLDQYFSSKTYQAIYACGPKALELAVQQRYKNHPHTYLSAEARMACGIGICNACVIHTADEKVKKVCTDGPVFQANEVYL